jgi:hypothetical protein
MDRACSMNVESIGAYRVLVRKPERRRHYTDRWQAFVSMVMNPRFA